jgi:hypothetical protein
MKAEARRVATGAAAPPSGLYGSLARGPRAVEMVAYDVRLSVFGFLSAFGFRPSDLVGGRAISLQKTELRPETTNARTPAQSG